MNHDFGKEVLEIDKVRELIKNTMKVKDVSVTEMCENGLNHNFLYNMRSFYPRCDLLYVMSRTLGVSMEYLVTGQDNNSNLSLSREEMELIEGYRKLPKEGKQSVKNVVSLMGGR